VDDQQREHIRDDLRGFVKGELLFDDLARALYSTDASIFQVRPLGVVVPRDEEDVQAIVRYAAEHLIPLVPRGAGTGVAGESLGSGLILDLSQNFRAILDVAKDTVSVQPGVTCRELNDRLARVGRRFAPDPGTDVCTIGGMLATNASGSRALKHGYTRDHVASLRLVLDTGDVVAAGQEPIEPQPVGSGHLQDIISATAVLLEQNAEVIRTSRPRTPFNRCGYLLHDVLGDRLDLPRLLVGSEGTLALFTEATLHTIPLPAGQSVVILGFENLDTALRTAQRILPSGPAACELLDRRLLSLARGSDVGGVASLIPAEVEAALLVEYESDSPREARAAALEVVKRFHRSERVALHALTALERGKVNQYWRLREAVLPSLYGLRGGTQPIAFIEDVGVPPEELPGYLHRVQEILKEHETTASFLVHTGAGQVHTRPFVNLENPEDVAKLGVIAEKVHTLALDLGGTVSSQHGTGIARTPWVARQYGPLYPVMQQLKTIFDPRGIFNPGKIIGTTSDNLAWPLREQTRRQGDRETGRGGDKEIEEPRGAENGEGNPVSLSPCLPVSLSLNWRPDEMRQESINCNGCGLCRTCAAPRRMCPIFRTSHAEAASPRAKANLMRHLLQESSEGLLLSSDEVRAVADLCVNCKMCALECPAHVNIPKLMLEAKAANVAEHGLSLKDWFLARIERFAWLGSAFAFVGNLALTSRTIRWLLDKVFGLSRQRRLPRFAARSFLRRAARRGWTLPPHSRRPRVAYFVDVFANYIDPSIGEAAVAVLHHNGIEVYVPPGQQGCGVTALAYGDTETAREIAQINLRVLAELAREGYPIVCSEPTAALMLRQDYLHLLDDPDARLVAEKTVELTSFLGELYTQCRLRTDFRPLDFSVGHHVPCHLKALGQPPVGPSLLALVPGLRVQTIDVSCSGMAGTFGLSADNYQTSQEAGRPMLEELRQRQLHFGSTECSTCRMQMENGTRKRTLHPVQYLALAYGLMPELARRLEEPVYELVL
jgi:FAD/FMN-containing dehydrogenase/Fe-S oxidoreductase